MKKLLVFLLAVLMIVGSVVSVTAFDDVNGKYAGAINGLQGTGIVAGKSETEFAPDELVTRWQMALFMARATSAITDDANWAEGAALFTDCTQYLGAIQYCFTKGIIKGVTATEFAPNANITLRDGVIMAVRALGYEKADEGKEASAKKYNVTGATYWLPYYQTGSELGLLENLETVAVTKELTRAETAQLIYNMLYTPVYVKDGANTNNYTLYDVAFGGKAIVEVENSMKAWITETPGYFFGEEGTLAADAEEIIIAWNTEDGVDTASVTFDDLVKYGVDIENIDEYFAATLEIINYNEDDVADFEYLANFVKTEAKVLDNSDVKYFYDNQDAFKYAKIDTKTHYAATADAKNTIELFVVATADDDLDAVKYTDTTFAAIDGKDYDLIVYDVDDDNYFEYGYVNLYKMDVYEEANVKGEEQFGDMDGLTEVIYTETLEEGDVFVYAFDLATKTVSVKEVVEASIGKITGYSEKKTDDGVYGYVTIDGTKYTIDPTVETAVTVVAKGDVVINSCAELRATAAAAVTDTYEYYTLGGKLIGFGEKQIEEKEVNYLVLKDCTDFKLYDYVVVEAFIDGDYEEIKVKKIARLKEDGALGAIVKLDTKGYSALAKELEDLFGIYTYTVDADGYYTVKECNLAYNVADFAEGLSIKFTDGVQTNAKVSTTEEAAGLIARNKMLRIDSGTEVYLIDMAEQKITAVEIKTSGDFEIPVVEGATFYADKIGFGKIDDALVDFEHGVASVIYITTAAIETVDAADYKLIFVQEDVADLELGTAESFGITDTDEDEDANQTYVKYDVAGKAYVLSTFATVDTIYVEGKANKALEAGAYVIDFEGKVAGFVALSDIAAADLGTIRVPVKGGYAEGGVDFGFVVTEIASAKIDLYNYSDIRINGATGVPFNTEASFATKNNLDSNIKAIKFLDYITNADDELVAKTYEAKVAASTEPALIKLMGEYEDAGETVKVIIAGNYATGKIPDGKTENDRVFLSAYTAVSGNTLTGVIINGLVD